MPHRTYRPLARTALLSCALLLLACATPRETVFIAPTHETVIASLEPAYGGGQHIVVQNNSTVEIVVTSVRLSECENIRNRCDMKRLRVAVGPRGRHRIMTVELGNRDRRYNFRYSFTWEAAEAAPPAIPGIPSPGR